MTKHSNLKKNGLTGLNTVLYTYIYIYIYIYILLYGCTTWTLTKRLEKKQDGNYTRMLRAILNKSCQQHPTRHQLYGHLPPITKTIQARRTRHSEHCWRSRDKLIGDVLLCTPTYGQAKAGQPARTYIQHLCEDTGCSLEDLPEAMNDRDKWWEGVWDIRASGMTWCWWYIYIYIYISVYIATYFFRNIHLTPMSVSSSYRFRQGVIMASGGIVFDLYSDDRHDWVTVRQMLILFFSFVFFFFLVFLYFLFSNMFYLKLLYHFSCPLIS